MSGSVAWKLHQTARGLAWLCLGGVLCLCAGLFFRFYDIVPPNHLEVEAVNWGIPVVSGGLVAVCVLRWLQWVSARTAVFETDKSEPVDAAETLQRAFARYHRRQRWKA